MKILIVLEIFAVFYISSVFMYVHFEKLNEAHSSNITIHIRKVSVFETYFEILLTFIKPMREASIELKLWKFDDNGNARQLFKTPIFDYCSVVSKKSRSNPLTRTFLLPILRQQPKLVNCPLTGQWGFNASFESKRIMMFPNGRYKLRFHAFNDEDPDVLTLALTMKIEY
ncbi:hypothetical protein PVAND_016503 [Polypedilum vanderplanki]|uniref:Uncharacterized protein n=1 Tax=Polypedilum vanderplanki TaxID=319348 RepID=A0A9J6BGG7_POLVA|nr:hypothetical protein PVAND_016503 [Polypedilum vanderplanki]